MNNSPVRHRPACPKISLLVEVENLVEIWLNLVKTERLASNLSSNDF